VRLRVAAFLILLAPALGQGADIDRFSLSAGIGYELVSQEYFLDSLVQVGLDTLEATVTLRTDYLDDLKGMLRLCYRPFDADLLKVQAQLEQTPELLRSKLYLDSRLELGASRLTLSNEWEWRSRYEGAPESGDEYWYGALRIRMDNPVGRRWSQWIAARGSFVAFDSTASFNYDYYRLEGQAGLSHTFADFSLLSGYLFVSGRRVADSSRLNYTSYGANFFGMMLHANGDLDLNARVEHRDYNQDEGQSDYTRLEIYGRNNIRTSGRLGFRQELDLDYSVFDDSDFVNADAFRLEVIALGGLTGMTWSVLAGPEFAVLWEQETEFAGRSDYLEGGLQLAVDYISTSLALVSLESTFGKRNYKFDSDLSLQTDYWYERLSLLGDVSVSGGLSFNVLASAEWEWHAQEDENNRIVLLSSTLVFFF
jgi:hypothetical protein